MYNDSLLELMATFSPNEKNNFKRYIAFTGGGRVLKYEELYNLYNKQLNKGYNKVTFDKKVQAALKKNPTLNKDLNNIRKRLKDKLLESLVIQSSSNNKIEEISKGINEVRILDKRKLHHAAIQKIKQLKDKAYSFNLNKFLVELIEMEIPIIEKSSSKNDELKLQYLVDAQQNHFNLYSIEMTLKNTFVMINIIVEKDLQLSKKKHVDILHKLYSKLDDIEIDDFAKNKQVYIVLWYYRVKGLYNRLMDNIEASYTYGKRLIDFFEKDEVVLKNFQNEYVKAICSFSRTCFHLDKKTELNRILLKVQNVYEHQKKYNALEVTCDMGVLHYLNSFNYKKADEIANLVDKNWQNLQQKTMDGKLLWYTHTNSIFYWIIQDQQKFELWTNRGLSIRRPNKGKMLFFGLRMLMLTYDYDNKEFLYFNEKVQALQKTMSNNDDLKVFEKLVLKYIKKIANVEMSAHPKKEKATLTLTLFKEFKAALLTLKEGKTNFISPINYEEISLWVESHLQNKSIKAVFEAAA